MRRVSLDDTRGMATAELAVALTAVALVLALVVGSVGALLAQLRCGDAARAAVRVAARGEPAAAAAAAARALAPAGAAVVVEPAGTTVTVRVGVDARLLPTLPALRVEAVAVAEREPGVP